MNLSGARQRLLRNPFIYRANAYIKASATRRSLAALSRRYTSAAQAAGVRYDASATIDNVRDRLARRGIARTGQRPLQIFWVGANWPQDSSGFLQSLEAFGRVRTFENARGTYGLLFQSSDGRFEPYDPQLIEQNDRALLAQVEDAHARTGIDLLLGQMWASFVSARALRHVQSLGVPVVNVSMDDRWPIHWASRKGVRLGSVGLKDGVDLVLTTSPECCLWYAVEGCPALYWPLASDPRTFSPVPEADQRHDVTFIGTRYGLRGRIVDALQSAGIAVDAFGAGWPNGSRDVNEAARIFAESKIILGVGTIGHSSDLFQLKLRDFDAPMAGALYITHRNPDLLQLYEEDREIVCYTSIDECVRKVKHYLQHPAERIAIAQAGAARARKSHTWATRLSYLFDVLQTEPRRECSCP